jgi:hypothetical protein
MGNDAETSSSASRGLAPFLKWSGWVVFVLTVLMVVAVVSLALWFRASPPKLWISVWIAAIAGTFVVGVRYGPWSGFGLVLLATGVFALWWMTILPSNDRDWQPDVAELLTAEVDPDDSSRVMLHSRPRDLPVAAAVGPACATMGARTASCTVSTAYAVRAPRQQTSSRPWKRQTRREAERPSYPQVRRLGYSAACDWEIRRQA